MRKQNPFGGKPETQALCVMTKSFEELSFIEKTLEKLGHEYSIEDNVRTMDLLYNYNPISNKYKKTEFGRIIKESYENPEKLYFMIFNECHKYLERINDHLQILSKQRNDNKRFIGSNDPYDSIFSMLENSRGRLLLPDNLGIILLTSKPNIVVNSDIRNRVDIIELSEAQRDDDLSLEFLINKIEKR